MAVEIKIDVDASKAISDTEKLKQANAELKNSILETTKAEKEASIARKDAAAAAAIASKEQITVIKQQELAIKAANQEIIKGAKEKELAIKAETAASIKAAKEKELAIKAETAASIKAAKEQELSIKERAQQLKELTAEEKKAAAEFRALKEQEEKQVKASADAHAFAIGKVMIAYDLFKQGLSIAIDAIKSVASAFMGAVGEAIQFEKALTDIKTIAPTTDMQALSKSLLDVSAAWGVDKITAAAAQYDIMSSGITDAGEAFKVFEGAAKLAVATGAQTSETAKTITAAINAWGMSASDVGQVMDSLAITTQDGVVRMSELGPVFGQVAATAASAGVTLQELNSGIAALTLGGTPAAQAGTQLKAVIAGLLKPSEELAAAFKKQAGESTASYLASNGLAKTLEILKVVTRGNAEETSRLFGSQEAVAGLLPLITTQSDSFTRSLDKQNAAIKEGGKVTQDMADIVAQSADFQLNKLSTTLSALGVDLAQSFVPAVAAGAKIIVGFAEDIRAFVADNKASFEAAGKSVKDFILNFGDFVQAIRQSEEFKISFSAVKDIISATAQATKEAADIINASLTDAFRGSTLTVEEFKAAVTLIKNVIINSIIVQIQGAAVAFSVFGQKVAEVVNIISKLTGIAVNIGQSLGVISVETKKAVSANDLFNASLIASEDLFKKEKEAVTQSGLVIGAYMTQEEKAAKLKGITKQMTESEIEVGKRKNSLTSEEIKLLEERKKKEQEMVDAGYVKTQTGWYKDYFDTIETGTKLVEKLADVSSKAVSVKNVITTGPLKTILSDEQKAYDTMVANMKSLASISKTVVSNIGAAANSFKSINENSSVGEKLNAASNALSSLSNVITMLPGPIGEIGGLVIGLASTVMQLPEIMKQLPQMITGIVSAIPLVITELIAQAPVLITSLIAQIPLIIKSIVDSLPEIVTGLLRLIVSPEFAISVVKAIFDAIGSIIDFKSWGKQIWEGLVNAVSEAGEFIANIGVAIWNGFAALVETIWIFFSTLGAKIWEGLSFLVEEMWLFFSDLGSAIWDGIKQAFIDAGDWLADVGSAIWSGIAKAFATAGDWLADVGGAIWNGLKKGLVDAWEWFKDIGRKIWEGLSEGLSSIGSFITGQNSSTGIPVIGPIIDEVGSWFGFAKGGLVAGQASVQGDSTRNDTVPALLSPGEMVIPRSAMNDGLSGIVSFARDALGQPRLGMANGGIIPGGAFPVMNTSNLESRLISLEMTMREIGYALAKTSMRSANLLDEWNSSGIPETRTI